MSVGPAERAAATASSISASVAIPVDMTSGRPVAAMRRTSGRSTSSNEATLKAGTSIATRKSTAVGSNGLEKQSIPSDSASALRRGCHSHGVYASWYRSYSVVPFQSDPAPARKDGASLAMVIVSAV